MRLIKLTASSNFYFLRIIIKLFIVNFLIGLSTTSNAQVSYLNFRLFHALEAQKTIPNVMAEHAWAATDTSDEWGTLQLALLESRLGTYTMARLKTSDYYTFNSYELQQISAFEDTKPANLYMWKANDWVAHSNKWYLTADSIFALEHLLIPDNLQFYPVQLTLFMLQNYPYLQHRQVVGSFAAFQSGNVQKAIQLADSEKYMVLLDEWNQRAAESTDGEELIQISAEIHQLQVFLVWKMWLLGLVGKTDDFERLYTQLMQSVEKQYIIPEISFIKSFFDSKTALPENFEPNLPLSADLYSGIFKNKMLTQDSIQPIAFTQVESLAEYPQNLDFHFEALEYVRRILKEYHNKEQLSECRYLLYMILQSPILHEQDSYLVQTYHQMLSGYMATSYIQNVDYQAAAECIAPWLTLQNANPNRLRNIDKLLRTYFEALEFLPHSGFHDIKNLDKTLQQNIKNNTSAALGLHLAKWHFKHGDVLVAKQIADKLNPNSLLADSLALMEMYLLKYSIYQQNSYLDSISAMLKGAANKYDNLAFETELLYLERDMNQPGNDALLQARLNELNDWMQLFEGEEFRLYYLLSSLQNRFLLRTDPIVGTANEISLFATMWYNQEISDLDKFGLMANASAFLQESMKLGIAASGLADVMINSLQETKSEETYLSNTYLIRIMHLTANLWLESGQKAVAMRYCQMAENILADYSNTPGFEPFIVENNRLKCLIHENENPQLVITVATDALKWLTSKPEYGSEKLISFFLLKQAIANKQLYKYAEAWKSVNEVRFDLQDTSNQMTTQLLKGQLYMSEKKYSNVSGIFNQELFKKFSKKYNDIQARGNILHMAALLNLKPDSASIPPFTSFISDFSSNKLSDTISLRQHVELCMLYAQLLLKNRNGYDLIKLALNDYALALTGLENVMPQQVNYYIYRLHVLQAEYYILLLRGGENTSDWDKALEQIMHAESSLQMFDNKNFDKEVKGLKDQLFKIQRN